MSQKTRLPPQENDSLPDPLRGNNTISNNSRQHPCSTNDDNYDVHSPVNTHQPSVNSPVNNNFEETDLVHLGIKPQDESSLFIETGKRKFKALWIQVQDNVSCLLIVTMPSQQGIRLIYFLA